MYHACASHLDHGIDHPMAEPVPDAPHGAQDAVVGANGRRIAFWPTPTRPGAYRASGCALVWDRRGRTPRDWPGQSGRSWPWSMRVMAFH